MANALNADGQMVQASTVKALAVVDLYKRVLFSANPIDGIASNGYACIDHSVKRF